MRLFDVSSERLRLQDTMRRALGVSVGRLHAKLGFIDDRVLLVGSMNLDPRSATSNTEPLRWMSRDAQGTETVRDEPALPWWQRLWLWLLSSLVSDDLL